VKRCKAEGWPCAAVPNWEEEDCDDDEDEDEDDEDWEGSAASGDVSESGSLDSRSVGEAFSNDASSPAPYDHSNPFASAGTSGLVSPASAALAAAHAATTSPPPPSASQVAASLAAGSRLAPASSVLPPGAAPLAVPSTLAPRAPSDIPVLAGLTAREGEPAAVPAVGSLPPEGATSIEMLQAQLAKAGMQDSASPP